MQRLSEWLALVVGDEYTVIIDGDEWAKISAVLEKARELSDAAQDGKLRGAINQQSDAGKLIIPLLRDIDLATRALPTEET